MAKKPVQGELTKSETVRQYLETHRGATIGEIVTGLKSQGILVSSALASYVKYARLGAKTSKPSPVDGGDAAPRNALPSDTVDAIRAEINLQGDRIRPRDIVDALAAKGVAASLAEVCAVAKSLGMRPRRQR